MNESTRSKLSAAASLAFDAYRAYRGDVEAAKRVLEAAKAGAQKLRD